MMFQTCPILGHEPVPVPAHSNIAETKEYTGKPEVCTANSGATIPRRASAEGTCL